MSNQSYVSVDPKTASEAYELLLPTLRAIPPESLQRVPFPVPQSIEWGFALYEQAQKDQDLMISILVAFDTHTIEGVRIATMALWSAQNRWLGARKRANQDKIDALMVQLTQARMDLLLGGDFLWRRNELVKKQLSDIRQGSGQRDTADDVQRLATIYRERWKEVDGRIGFTKEDIDAAEKLAVRLIEILSDDNADEALELRNRAWSHWYQTCQEVHFAGRYIHRFHSEKTQLYPTLSAVIANARSSTQSSKPEEVSESPTQA
ncbi:MAG: hypothetical protein AAGJ35_07270 [Myxococcota bacterium]